MILLIRSINARRMDLADAAHLAIPHIVLASKDEPADAVKGYAETITNNENGGLVKTYSSMWHGWMGARANLDQEESRAEYTREQALSILLYTLTEY
jgi:hypothetical protein